MQDDMLKEVINLIKSSNEIVVFSGAGISTNSGILDFRSSDGLYNLIEQNYDLPYPEAIFDIEYFVEDPGPFFDFTSTLLLQSASPTRCHEFIAWLEEQDKISLVVTQNIDMLHHLAGSTKVIECHGTFRTAHCIDCDCEYSLEDIEQNVLDGVIPRCECGGIIKPDTVFFGEELPEEFYTVLESHPKADLLLILGTALDVQPASRFALELSEKVPSVLVNLEPTRYDDQMTYVFHKDLDDFTESVWPVLEDEALLSSEALAPV